MNPKLIKDITDRVKQVEKAKEDESVLAAHLDAIAEVYGTDRVTVESIARDIIAKGGTSPIGFVQIRNILWISALVLIIISVIWLLYNNLQITSKTQSDELSKSDQRTVGYVAEALASLNVVKISTAEHVASVGAMPSSFSEIGIKESEVVTTKYIDRLKMSDDGTITASLSSLIGEQHYIKLKPILRIGSYQVEWDCRSNLKALILDKINGCTPD